MNNQNSLDHLRHSFAHLLAAAVMELYPDAKRTIGPPIANGFYYDFEFSSPISEDDLPKIEQKMRELVKSWDGFERHELSVEDALKENEGNEYKKELIHEFAGKGEKISVYQSGKFRDLCRGGHVEHPSKELKHFKLLSVAGAYWRGDEKNKMLTRIYGTAFETKEELEKYLWQREEAKKRDHKKLGKELDLFLFSDLVGPGLPLWTPKGTVLRDLLAGYVEKLRLDRGYQKVTIPHLAKKELYETSGHWTKFANELFRIKTREGHEFAMKPMNCPHHTQIFAHIPRSYKDMPQRYTETTMVYRDEQTGELSGLSRVRSVTQDDAHVFCRPNQLKEELLIVWDIVHRFYETFGFKLKIRLSFHDPENQKAYLGSPETWKKSEGVLEEIAKEQKADYFVATGEAAFYGPKIDFMATDSLEREWQVATIQLDMNMPERFDLYCIDEQNKQERVVMIHAAIMGSIERFLSILIEHMAGAFPTWLSPVQVAVLPISEKHGEYANKIGAELKKAGIRYVLDADQRSVGYKIRQSTLQKIPYMIIIGDKEMQNEKGSMIAVRTREGKDLGTLDLYEFISTVKSQIEKYI